MHGFEEELSKRQNFHKLRNPLRGTLRQKSELEESRKKATKSPVPVVKRVESHLGD